jgi:hypothetical protein
MGWWSEQVAPGGHVDIQLADDFVATATFTTVSVIRDGVETLIPLGLATGNFARKVWAFSEDEIFIAGATSFDCGGFCSVYFGWVSQYDGESWTQGGPTPAIFASEGINDIWASTPNDVFAVGGQWTQTETITIGMRYDGTAWTSYPAGSGRGDAVWGLDADNVYMGTNNGRIAKFDGELETWQDMPWEVANGRSVRAITGSAPDNLYAAGNNGLIAHFDGVDWSLLPSTTTANLLTATILEDGTPFFGGEDGELFLLVNDAVRKLRTPTVADIDFMGVDESGLVVVGDVSTGVAHHFYGDGWLDIDVPATANITALFADGEHIFAKAGAIWHGDGESWTTVGDSSNVFAASRWDNVAVGTTGEANHFDGASWTTKPLGVSGRVRAMALTDDAGFAVVTNGLSAVYDAGSGEWTALPDPVGYNNWSLWGSGSEFWSSSTTYDGTTLATELHHYDGVNLVQMRVDSASQKWKIWGTAADDVYIVGLGGNALHYDGTGLSPIDLGTAETLVGIGGTSIDEIFLRTALGQTLRLDGSDWLPMTGPDDSPTTRLLHDGTFYGSGDQKLYRLYKSSPW